MRKLVTTIIVTGLLVGLGAAAAQANEASHDVEIRIPNVLMLRITNGSDNSEAANPRVDFDFQTNLERYMDHVDAGGGDLEPTGVVNFGDVIVFSNRASWQVGVAATAISFVNNFGLTDVLGFGIELTDITVQPNAFTPTTFVTVREANWSLATDSRIAAGVRTQGWRSLGFSGDDYRLNVTGEEDPGTYTTTVTYSITAP